MPRDGSSGDLYLAQAHQREAELHRLYRRRCNEIARETGRVCDELPFALRAGIAQTIYQDWKGRQLSHMESWELARVLLECDRDPVLRSRFLLELGSMDQDPRDQLEAARRVITRGWPG